MTNPILTLNCGSSSIKAALFDGNRRLHSALVERIGLPDTVLIHTDHEANAESRISLPTQDHEGALSELLNQLPTRGLKAVGHRIVHGGPSYSDHQRVSTKLIEELHRIVPFVPLHLPSEITAMEVLARRYLNLKQFACFDTAFHRTLPEVAQTLPLPLDFREKGIRRYGFHGLSYEYLVEELRNRELLMPRVLLAHLGNGCSMAAVRDGKCIDTTMSFTPAAGLVMGTRPGDLDPGLVVYLLQQLGMSVEEVHRLIHHASGLLGVSGISSDVRTLEQAATNSPAARLALDLFAYQARKHIGALVAALRGLDVLVFSAGIGEHSASLRWAIASHLQHLGVQLDEHRNQANETVISTPESRATVLVLKTNEEEMIARHVVRLYAESP